MAELKLVLSCLSAGSSLLGSGFRFTQFVFEIRQVDRRARDLLNRTKSVDDTVFEIQRQRDAKQAAGLLDESTVTFIDGKLATARMAVDSVVKLLEPLYADQIAQGHTSVATRALFIIRDASNVTEISESLVIAYQGLTQALSSLQSAGMTPVGAPIAPRLDSTGPLLPIRRSKSDPSATEDPPTYEQSQYHDSSWGTRSEWEVPQPLRDSRRFYEAEPYEEGPRFQGWQPADRNQIEQHGPGIRILGHNGESLLVPFGPGGSGL